MTFMINELLHFYPLSVRDILTWVAKPILMDIKVVHTCNIGEIIELKEVLLNY